MKIEERQITIDQQVLAVVAGNTHLQGSPLVFIHGVLASVNFWHSVIPEAVLEAHPWVSISLPGHFPSTLPAGFDHRDITEEWMATLYHRAITHLIGSTPYVLIGHSTGGFAALNLAARQPAQLLGVISIAGFYHGGWGGIEGMLVKIASLGEWAKPLFIANLALGRSINRLQKILSSYLAHDREAYLASPVTERMLSAIQGNIQGQTLSQLFPLFNRIATFSIRERLEDIHVPVWLLVGTHDPVIHAQQSLVLSQRIPGARTVVFEDTGHMPFMERTTEFTHEFQRAVCSLMPVTDKSTEVEYEI